MAQAPVSTTSTASTGAPPRPPEAARPIQGPSQQQLGRRGLERLDLMLLSVEALDLNGGEAMLWISEQLGFRELFPNRVALWTTRCHNPLRRHTRRGVLDEARSDALIRILAAMAERLYPMLRQLLSSSEPQEVSAQRWELFRRRLAELVRERFNLRRGGVQNLLHDDGDLSQHRRLVQSLALGAGPGGFERLKASLQDAAR
ncbi:MAG: DUF3038 domain-containing protein [Prochlorococcaceae cyanobacterium]